MRQPGLISTGTHFTIPRSNQTISDMTSKDITKTISITADPTTTIKTKDMGNSMIRPCQNMSTREADLLTQEITARTSIKEEGPVKAPLIGRVTTLSSKTILATIATTTLREVNKV